MLVMRLQLLLKHILSLFSATFFRIKHLNSNFQFSQKGFSALLVAAKLGRSDKVTHLIAGGADVNIADFVISIFFSVALKFPVLLKSGRTALHFAAWGEHDEVAELLLVAKADVNAKDQV